MSRTFPLRTLGLLLLGGSLLATRPSGAQQVVQRLLPGPSQRQTLQTRHFTISFDPTRLSREQAEEAGQLAEKGWDHCAVRFGTTAPESIRLDLSPNFTGATGFAVLGDPRGRTPQARLPGIGVRYAELEYLGLPADYVLTHEIAHVFSGSLASTTLGEGVADWGAGSFAGIPMAHWWGKALRGAGLWIETEGLFINGEFPSNAEVNERTRTARYGQAGLLVFYLAERFGWEKTRAFLDEYGRARGLLDSNEDRFRFGRPGRRGPSPPVASQVRGAFERVLGVPWERLRQEWEQKQESEPVPAALAERLVLGHRIYGSIRSYEMWLIAERDEPAPTLQQLVREAFTRANQALRRGEYPAAREHLGRARGLVEHLKNPPLTT